MNYAIILSGGVGSRVGANIPKQYIKINGKTILSYCLEVFERHQKIDKIVVVASKEYHPLVLSEVNKYGIKKFFGIADAGESRQHSILNGLSVIKEFAKDLSDKDVVLVHDGVRPNITNSVIDACLDFDGFDGALPVIKPQDTIYFSDDAKEISGLLDRSKLFLGQSPEVFLLKKYKSCYEGITNEELSLLTGSSQLAHKRGMRIKLVCGDVENFKITTMYDLERFKHQFKIK